MQTEITADKTYAQNQEDIGICTYLKGLIEAEGVEKSFNFLDIGANDGKTFSNTHLLTELFPQYVGYFVEPHPEAFKRLKALYKPSRPGQKHKHKFFNYAIGLAPGKMKMHLNGSHLKTGDVGLLSTLVDADKERWKDTEQWTETEVDVVTYPFANKKFDFISIDAEGMDEAILTQIDLSHTFIICIEWNSNVQARERIQQYCSKFGFGVVHSNAENLILIKSAR